LKEVAAYLGITFYAITTEQSLSALGMQSDDLPGLAQGLSDVVRGYYSGSAPKVFPAQLKKGDIVIDDLLRLMFKKCGLAAAGDDVMKDDVLHTLVGKAQGDDA
jgi:hypothetical protein